MHPDSMVGYSVRNGTGKCARPPHAPAAGLFPCAGRPVYPLYNTCKTNTAGK